MELFTLAEDIISEANVLLLNNADENEWQDLAKNLLKQVIYLTKVSEKLEVKNT